MTTTFTERIARLGPAQRTLLETRLEQPPTTEIPLSARAARTSSPASPTQKSMWFVHNLDPEVAVFNHTHAARIKGALDVEALGRALVGLVRRHEILRTNYRMIDDELTQIIQDPPDGVLTVHELQGDHDDLALRKLIEAQATQPFDLEKDDMYRAVLYKLADDEFVLTRTNHHISFDRWSAAIVNQETAELYEAEIRGRSAQLTGLDVQYSDFTDWQLENLSAEALEARLRFFTSHIAGVSDSLDFPTDHARTGAQGPAATLPSQLSGDLASRVRSMGREHGATPFMVLLAAFGVLMGRYARAEQILIGVPVALRNRPELTGLVGPLINTIVLRLDLRENPSFLELVERVRRTSLNMIPHQDLPFDELVRAVAPQRVATTTPLFQVMFDYLNTPHTELALADLEVEPIPLETGASAHDLTLYIEDRPSDIRSRWEYRDDLFDRATMGGLAAAYESMVEQFIADPETRIDEIGLLDADNDRRVRSLGAGPAGRTTPFFDSIEARRNGTPDAIAVTDTGTGVTYDGLASSAREIAIGLREKEVATGDTVALLLHRSIDLVTAFLGAMMAGANALLLDPDQPPARLMEMLSDAKPAVVLSDSNVPDVEDQFPTVSLSDMAGQTEETSFVPLVPLDVDHRAYTVFTSGSTGSPKGVVVGHESLNNFVTAAVDLYGLTPSDRVLQFASPGFDTFVEEVIPTLSSGGTIVLRPPDLYSSFEDFERFVAENQVTVLDLPTAWWHAWVEDMTSSKRALAPGVRVVIVGGEAAMADRWRDWTRLTGQTRWINTYGPSEGTVVVSTFEPTARYRPTGRVMPIGRPIRNTTLVIVDSLGFPLPPRLVGEIVIEGEPVALGYHQEARSQSGFEVDAANRRRYRTGDLGRLLPDGTVEFLGRVDSQIKVRGTRVEPAEVEAALTKHPAIADAMVAGDPDGSGLVGHVVSSDPNLDENLVRRHLAERLPEPMIPGRWRFHGSLPYTPGGKLDRKLLERMTALPEEKTKPFLIEPRSDLERQLLEIWESVLERSRISMDDSFFDLGGHSLLGVKLISRISATMGLQLPLKAIFETPTIEAIARSLESADV